MDGWVDGWMYGRTDGRTDEWIKSIVWGHTIKNLKHHKSFLFVSPIFKISPTKPT